MFLELDYDNENRCKKEKECCILNLSKISSIYVQETSIYYAESPTECFSIYNGVCAFEIYDIMRDKFNLGDKFVSVADCVEISEQKRKINYENTVSFLKEEEISENS